MNDWQTNSCDIVGYEVDNIRGILSRSNTLMVKGIKQKTKPSGEISKHFDIGDTFYIERDLRGSSMGRSSDVVIYNIDKDMSFKVAVGIARRELDKFILMEYKKEQW